MKFQWEIPYPSRHGLICPPQFKILHQLHFGLLHQMLQMFYFTFHASQLVKCLFVTGTKTQMSCGTYRFKKCNEPVWNCKANSDVTCLWSVNIDLWSNYKGLFDRNIPLFIIVLNKIKKEKKIKSPLHIAFTTLATLG